MGGGGTGVPWENPGEQSLHEKASGKQISDLLTERRQILFVLIKNKTTLAKFFFVSAMSAHWKDTLYYKIKQFLTVNDFMIVFDSIIKYNPVPGI